MLVVAELVGVRRFAGQVEPAGRGRPVLYGKVRDDMECYEKY